MILYVYIMGIINQFRTAGGTTSDVLLLFSLQGTDRQGKSIQSQGIPQQSQTGMFQQASSASFRC